MVGVEARAAVIAGHLVAAFAVGVGLRVSSAVSLGALRPSPVDGMSRLHLVDHGRPDVDGDFGSAGLARGLRSGGLGHLRALRHWWRVSGALDDLAASLADRLCFSVRADNEAGLGALHANAIPAMRQVRVCVFGHDVEAVRGGFDNHHVCFPAGLWGTRGALDALELADLVLVAGDRSAPCGAAIDEACAFDENLQRGDAVGFFLRRDCGEPSRLTDLGPGLPKRPCEAPAADVGELDLWVPIGLAEYDPGATHKGASVKFGHGSAVHREGVFAHWSCSCFSGVILNGS